MSRIINALVLSFLLGTVAHARPPRGEGPPPPPVVLEKNAEEIGLSQADVAAMTAVFDAHRDEVEALHDKGRAAHENGDRETARALHEQSRELRDTIFAEALTTVSADKAEAVRSFFDARRSEHEGDCDKGGRRGGER